MGFFLVMQATANRPRKEQQRVVAQRDHDGDTTLVMEELRFNHLVIADNVVHTSYDMQPWATGRPSPESYLISSNVGPQNLQPMRFGLFLGVRKSGGPRQLLRVP